MVSLDFYLYDIGRNTGHEIELYWGNITHNLNKMWHKADIYDELYNSDMCIASEITKKIKEGLIRMKEDPAGYKELDSPNGWGVYEHALEFLEDVIKGCEEFPEAYIRVSK